MKLTMFSLICLFVVLAFAGVQPIASYKDNTLESVTQWWSSTPSKSAKNTVIPQSKPTPTFSPTSVPTTSRTPASSLSQPTTARPDYVIDKNGFYIYTGKRPPYRGKDAVVLIENPQAHNPTWQELENFLKSDDTDSNIYLVWGVCAEFAEQVHNRAEERGIRTAYVGLDFVSGPGHALDAFETTDKGLVFIDCTGGFLKAVTLPQQGKTFGQTKSNDKVAYLLLGKEFGVISLNVVRDFSYSYYTAWRERLKAFETSLEQYNTRVKAFNQDVTAFNTYARSKTFYVGTVEWQNVKSWEARLDREKLELGTTSDRLDVEGNALGAFWEAQGIVARVEIYW